MRLLLPYPNQKKSLKVRLMCVCILGKLPLDFTEYSEKLSNVLGYK